MKKGLVDGRLFGILKGIYLEVDLSFWFVGPSIIEILKTFKSALVMTPIVIYCGMKRFGKQTHNVILMTPKIIIVEWADFINEHIIHTYNTNCHYCGVNRFDKRTHDLIIMTPIVIIVEWTDLINKHIVT